MNTRCPQTCVISKLLDPEEDEILIRNISQLTSGQKKKLKADEANILVKRLLQSILVNDELDESVLTETGAESETEGEHETDSESENEVNKTIKSIPNPDEMKNQAGQSGIDPNVQSTSGSATPIVIPKKEATGNFKKY